MAKKKKIKKQAAKKVKKSRNSKTKKVVKKTSSKKKVIAKKKQKNKVVTKKKIKRAKKGASVKAKAVSKKINSGASKKTKSLAEDKQWKQVEKFVESIVKDNHRTRLYFLKETFKAAYKLAREGSGTLNIKIAATALKELRYSFKMFFPHRFRPKITLFGSARSEPGQPAYELAKEFAIAAVEKDYMIITGGGPGAMQAGNEGAGSHDGFGLNIRLPFEQSANPFIDPEEKLIHYKYFFTRKLFLIKEAAALVVMPGGFGTFDECFELLTLLQTGKSSPVPIVFLEPKEFGFWKDFWDFAGQKFLDCGLISEHDLRLFTILHSADEAVAHIEQYYKNYHSLRQVRDELVLRIRKKLSASAMEKINADFGYLSTSGEIRQSGPLPQEKNEPELVKLPRLVFPWDQKDFAGLRMLIDQINLSS